MTNPITTAEEMREAAANIARGVARERGDDDYGMATALRIAERIEALPIAEREVPEAVRRFYEYQQRCGIEYAVRDLPDDHPDKIMRDLWIFLGKEFGL